MLGKITKLMELILPKLSGTKNILMSIIVISCLTLFGTFAERYIDHLINNMQNNISIELDSQVRNSVEEIIDSSALSYSNKIEEAIQNYPKIDLRIDNMLKGANEDLGTNKALVAIYHDGTKSPEGNPFLKYSITNEVILEKKYHIVESSELNQNVAFSRIAYYAEELNTKGFFYSDIESLKDINLNDYKAFKEKGVKSIIMIPLYKENNTPRGFLLLVGYDKTINYEDHKEYINLVVDVIENELTEKYGTN